MLLRVLPFSPSSFTFTVFQFLVVVQVTKYISAASCLFITFTKCKNDSFGFYATFVLVLSTILQLQHVDDVKKFIGLTGLPKHKTTIFGDVSLLL